MTEPIDSGAPPKEIPDPDRYGWRRTIRWRVLLAIAWCAIVIVGWASVEPREQDGWLEVVGIPVLIVAVGYLVAAGRIGMALVAFLSLGVGLWALLVWGFGAEAFVSDVGLLATLATIGVALLVSLATFIYLGLGGSERRRTLRGRLQHRVHGFESRRRLH